MPPSRAPRKNLARHALPAYPPAVRSGILAASAVLLATLASVRPVGAIPPARGARASIARGALSIGAPNDGRLASAEHLEPGPTLRIIPSFAGGDFRWGLPALIQLLQRAALRVSEKFPGAVMSVGDLSHRTGGEIRNHLSHQSGRDVDIGFYVSDTRGAPMLLPRFVEFDADGRCKDVPSARFDDARNWALIEALVSDRDAKVDVIFVSSALRARLIREALRQRAPLTARIRAARVMREPSTSTVHADHFHVRIACPPGQTDVCEPYPRRRSSANGRSRAPSRPR